MLAVSTGDMPDVGSSRSTTRGRPASAIASSSWRCSPWDSARAASEGGRGLVEIVQPLRGCEDSPGRGRLGLDREADVLQRREIEEQIVALEGAGQPLGGDLVRGQPRDPTAAQKHVAR
jgi:hypothetical protein